MTVTTQDSSQMARTVASGPKAVPTYDWHGRVRFAFFEFTQVGTGDAGSIARTVRLPAGKVRLILPLSRLAFAAMATGRTMDLGWEAYTDLAGDAVAADENGLDDGVNVASAGSVTPGGTIGTHETKLFESQDGVVLTAQINDGTITDGKTISGYYAYVVD